MNYYLISTNSKFIGFSHKINMRIFNYSLRDIILDNPDSIRDLGILFSHDLFFAEHFKNIISRVFRSLGFFKELLNFDTNTLR